MNKLGRWNLGPIYLPHNAFIALGVFVTALLYPLPYASRTNVSQAKTNRQKDVERVLTGGSELRAKGKDAEGEILWAAGLKNARALGNDGLTAMFLYNLGNVSDIRGRFQQAIAYHAEALRIRETFSDKADIANSVNNLAI